MTGLDWCRCGHRRPFIAHSWSVRWFQPSSWWDDVPPHVFVVETNLERIAQFEKLEAEELEILARRDVRGRYWPRPVGSWAPRRERRQPYLGQHVAFAALTLVGLALLIFYGHLTPWTLMVAFVAYIAGNSVHAVSLSATPDTVSVATGTGAVAPPPALPPLPTSWPELVDGLET